MDDAGAKRALTILSVLSIIVGIVLALCAYGSLEDVRSWNLVGLIYILVVGSGAGLIALRAWLRGRRKMT